MLSRPPFGMNRMIQLSNYDQMAKPTTFSAPFELSSLQPGKKYYTQEYRLDPRQHI